MLEIQIDEVEIWESKKENQENTEFQLRISIWVRRDTCGKNSEEQGRGGGYLEKQDQLYSAFDAEGLIVNRLILACQVRWEKFQFSLVG